MESQQSPSWSGIAQKVNALLALPGARERFEERVKEAAAESLRRSDLKLQREEARIEALRQTGVPYEAGHLPADPKDGSFCELQDLHDGGAPLEAWLPAELSPDLDPDDSPPPPVPDREVSPAERYAVLAAVWDVHWRGDKKLNPWIEDENCPEAIWYWSLLRAGDPRLAGARLTDEDAAVVQTWIDDVEADLPSGTTPAQGDQDVMGDGKAPETPGDPQTDRKVQAKKRLATAMVLVQDHPDWSDRQITRQAGYKNHSSLSRSETYQKAAAIARRKKVDLPRGTKDGETGSLEAWEEADEED
jgi:hypothetical protein